MVSTSYGVLVEEIERITTSPYPSQLRTLRDIVDSQCAQADISHWAASYPCRVEQLVSRLLEGLHQWPYVLDIITRFALDAACRDTFLRKEPTLLHRTMAKAVELGDVGSQYIKASIALLSVSLPATIALPAEAQTMFVQLVEYAAIHPSVAILEQVYLMLSGTGSSLLGDLSNDVLDRFEEHLIGIPRDYSDTPDMCLSLYCLAIMRIVCGSANPQFRLTASSFDSLDFLQSTPKTSRWTSDAFLQFFTGSRAQKTLQLLVLQVISASGKGNHSEEKVRSLALANEIVLAVPVDLRKNWCSSNPILIRKLQERFLVGGQNETIRTLGLRFLGKLCQLDSLAQPLVKAIELTVLDVRGVYIAQVYCPRVGDSELSTRVLAQAPVDRLLQNIVEFAIRADSPDLACGLEPVTQSFSKASTIILQQQIKNDKIGELLSDTNFTQNLERLQNLLSSDQGSGPQTSEWCCKALRRARSALALLISEFLIKVCRDSPISLASLDLLLGLHTVSARGESHCSHGSASGHELVALAHSQHDDELDAGDWRKALGVHFKARVQFEQATVTQIFSRACAKLEARCENIEAPLRKEQEKRQTVEERNEALTRALTEIETRNAELVVQTHQLEEEKDGYFGDLENWQEKHSGLLGRVSQLEQQLREVQIDGRKQLAELEAVKQMSELNSASVIAQKQHEVDDLHEQLEQASRDSAGKAEQLTRLQAGRDAAEAKGDRLEKELANSKTGIKDLENSVRSLQHINEDLAAGKKRMQDELLSYHSALASRSREIADLNTRSEEVQCEHEEMKNTLTQEKEDMQRDLTHRLEAAKSREQELQAKNEQQDCEFANLQRELQESQDKSAANIEARDVKILALKQATDRLQRTCEQKDGQIAEAQAMRTNLMAAMGFPADQRKLRRHSRESPVAPMQTPGDSTPPTLESCRSELKIRDANTSFASNASSQDSKSSSTPKRPRPRKRVAVVAPALRPAPRTRGSTGAKSQGRSVQDTRRQTLGPVTGNRGAVRPAALKLPLKEDPAGGENESTFDASELFSGTQGVEMVDLGEIGDNVSL